MKTDVLGKSWLAGLGLVAALTAACGGPPPVDPLGADFKETAVQLKLGGSYPEAPPPGFVPRATFAELRDRLRQIAEEPRAKGLLLELGPMGGGFGQLRDVQELVRAVAEAGKPVHCRFDVLDNAGYLFAAEVCQRLTMSPAAHLDLVGFASQLLFAADLLESIGVNAEIIAIGRYKSAGDVFTERDMPETTRETLSAILDQLTAELAAAVESRVGAGKAQAILDGGPYLSEDALRENLVDAVEYADAAEKALKEAAGVDRLSKLKISPELEQPSLKDFFRALSGDSKEEPRGRHVAVLGLSGNILDGDRGDDGSIVSGPVVERLRKLASDEEVVAVVLRIDSPGGSALASDLIYHEVRALAEKKPVIASISNMAASGGYYIAAGAKEIYARESSIVGSIGVIGGKVDLSPLATRLGLRTATLKRGKNAAYLSPLSPFDDHERAAVRRMLETTYARFVTAVAEGRDLSREQVLAAAEGRVYLAKAGKELGLVDSLEGFEAALARARELAGVDASVPARHYPERKDFFESLTEAFSPSAAVVSREAVLREVFPFASEPVLGWLLLLESSSGPYAILPFALDLR